MSQWYEDEEDRENEDQVAAVFCEKMRCMSRKLSPHKFVVDYALYDGGSGKIRALMEVRCRTQRSDAFLTFNLSAHKIQKMQALSAFLKVPAIIAVRWSDKLVWRQIEIEEEFEISMWGRPDHGPKSRGDEMDFEPSCLIPNDKKWRTI